MEAGGQHHVPAALPVGITPVPTEYETRWAPEPVWTFWRREKSLFPTGIQTPDRTVRSVVTLSRIWPTNKNSSPESSQN